MDDKLESFPSIIHALNIFLKWACNFRIHSLWLSQQRKDPLVASQTPPRGGTYGHQVPNHQLIAPYSIEPPPFINRSKRTICWRPSPSSGSEPWLSRGGGSEGRLAPNVSEAGVVIRRRIEHRPWIYSPKKGGREDGKWVALYYQIT